MKHSIVLMVLALVSIASSAQPAMDAALGRGFHCQKHITLQCERSAVIRNRFHCLQALWGTNNAPNGKWFFVFVSANGSSKGVSVFTDRKSQVASILSAPVVVTNNFIPSGADAGTSGVDRKK